MKGKLFLIGALLCARPVFAQRSFNAAQWISPADTASRHCPVFEKNFVLHGKVRSAALSITALGLYEAALNGRRIGDAYFTPGFTSYDHRTQYQQYDVTAQLCNHNELRIVVADGWYRGPFGGDLQRNRYGTRPALLAELSIQYTNGKEQMIYSDTSWRCTTGPILCSQLYDGELQDTRPVIPSLMPVTVLQQSKTIVVAQEVEPVRRQERFAVRQILAGNILDFGQNLAGWVEVNLKGNKGDTITIEHAETLDKDGHFFTANLREAKATDRYILNGATQKLHPHFTYHGFRYARVTGVRGPLDAKNFTAVALYSDLRRTGTFTSSDSLLDQLQHNIVWSQNSNFLDIPTDCSQRSERLGWTGDAQVFIRTAAFNRDVKRFFTKWIRDLAADQGADGSVPRIVPDVYGHRDVSSKGGVAGWGDAATIIPWTLFEVYADTNLLREQYPIMKKWVDYLATQAPDYLWKARGYGDWYAPGPATELPFIDACYFGYSTQLVSKAAAVLGLATDASKYLDLFDHIQRAFLNEFMTPDGRAVAGTQTAYVLALQFDLLPAAMQPKAARRLAELVRINGNHLATGFLGTPYLLPVLCRFGYSDLACTVLKQTAPPSWLYPLTKGATTIWEKWEAIRQDGSLDTCSLNHYAYGAVGDFLYRFIAGIRPAAPGYKRITIHPVIGGGLTDASATYQSRYGAIRSSWKIVDRALLVDVSIPINTTAIIEVPDGMEGAHYTSHAVGAGDYHYSVPLRDPEITFSNHPDWNFTVSLKKKLVVEPCQWPVVEKLLVLSDIEGEFEAFRNLLLNNGVIDTGYRWTFGKGHLVICGDLFDRGKQVTECLWLLYKLEDEAKAAGGYVHVILGNHDIMNLSGDLRYVDPEYFQEARAAGEDYRDWYSINRELGRWLRTKNILEKIGTNLYLHAGISPQVNRLGVSIAEINARARPLYDQAPEANVLFDGATSPFWYRGYFTDPVATMAQVDSTLAWYRCSKIIVGHTITDTTIVIKFDGKIIGIDVDHHEGVHKGLMITGDRNGLFDDKGNLSPLKK